MCRGQCRSHRAVAQVAGAQVVRSDIAVENTLSWAEPTIAIPYPRWPRWSPAARSTAENHRWRCRGHDRRSGCRCPDSGCRLDRRVGPDRGVRHLHAGRVAAELDAIAEIARDDAGADQVVAAGRRDQDSILPVRGRAREREDPGERIERRESARRAAHLDAVAIVAGDHVAQRDHAADLRVLGRARDQQSVAAVGHDRGVVGADAHEIGLDRGVVGVGDPQAVAAVAAEHVVEDERVSAGMCSRSVDCRWPSRWPRRPGCCPGPNRPRRWCRRNCRSRASAVAPPVMSTPLARLPEIRLPWGGRTNTSAGGIVAAGRLAADHVPRRAVRDQDAVLRVAALERAGGVRADVSSWRSGCRWPRRFRCRCRRCR